MLDHVWNAIVIRYKKVSVGRKIKIYGKIHVHGKKKGIAIGNNCVINSREDINPTFGYNHTHLVVGENGSIVIGNNVGMSHVCITAYDRIKIEDNVLLGSGVKVWDTDFHSIDYKERVQLNSNGKTKPITIQEGAFIGAGSIILKGVNIGKHAVIGAGAVVTKNIPDNEVWAGNPAKFVKKVNQE